MEVVADRGHKLGQPASSTWEESVESAGSVYGALSKPLHVGLDMLSYLPPADLAHSALYAAEGSPGMAALYAGFAIPGLGDYGQAGHLIHKYATAPIRVPMGKLWTNVKAPYGYTFPRAADLKWDDSYFKGLKRALWDDKPLWIRQVADPLSNVDNLGRKWYDSMEPITDLKNLLTPMAARYHLNRAAWGLKDKALKVSSYKKFEDVKDIHKSDIFKTVKESLDPDDANFISGGRLWKFNTDTKMGKELADEWGDLIPAPGHERYHSVLGNFGMTTRDGKKIFVDPSDWNPSKPFRSLQTSIHWPKIFSNAGDVITPAGKTENLGKYIATHNLYPHIKPHQVYDRMYDTWDFALNNPTWSNIFSNPVNFARHYGSKVFGLKPVKVVQDLSTKIDAAKLGGHLTEQELKLISDIRNLKYGGPGAIKNIFKPSAGHHGNLLTSSYTTKEKVKNKYFKRLSALSQKPVTGRKVREWNHPNPFDK